MYRLQIIKEAKAELAKELAYSRKKWGVQHAQEYGKALRASIKALQSDAKSYQVRSEILPDIRIKQYKGNRIIFTILEEESTVIVLAILSAYQSADTHTLQQRQKKAQREE